MNEIIQDKNELSTAKRMEIVDGSLWFKGYSIYLTAWCKKYLAIKIFDPNYDRRVHLDIKELYREVLLDWELHHFSSIERGIPVPLPPKLFQLEDAVRYFEAKKLIFLTEQSKPMFANSELLNLLGLRIQYVR